MQIEAPNSPDADDQQAPLWAAFKTEGSARARETLFNLYLPFARGIASRQFLDRRGDIEFPDLCQLAFAGLLEALDGFNPDFGVPFQRYAERRIRGSVLDGIVKTNEIREQISFRNRVRDERARSLAVENPGDLPAADAMAALVDAALGLALGFMMEGSGVYLPGDAVDDRADAYESLVWKEAVRRILAEISTLSDREQTIIRQHYLNGLNFEQIGQLLTLSKGRVSQIHRMALTALKTRLERSDHFMLER